MFAEKEKFFFLIKKHVPRLASHVEVSFRTTEFMFFFFSPEKFSVLLNIKKIASA